MEIEEAVWNKLTSDAAVAALAGKRVYPGQAPQSSALPVVVYQQANQVKLMSLTGPVNVNRHTMRLDLWAGDYAGAKALYHAVRDALVGYRGEMGAGQVAVLGVFEDGGDDGVEQPIHATEDGLFTAGLDLSIWYGAN